ncbi:MAG: bifunctional riboflavin kinase/FAD synthetase [Bacteroidales bacterium]|nr:bifunctional riboflavin kinase/FAD synthetase [Bacteroidales bacterium]
MKIFNNIEKFPDFKNPVITVGTFDGVHRGHQKIIEMLKSSAKELKGESVVITFEPHPRLALYLAGREIELLSTKDEKLGLLEKYGIQNTIIFDFTTEFAKMKYDEFIKEILIEKIKAKKLVVGFNHHFGFNREGNFEFLTQLSKTYNFGIEKAEQVDVNGVSVSSSKVREALLSGDIKLANDYLGYDYILTGKVVGGNKLGRNIGFPTANIQIEEASKLIPKNGVYAVVIEFDKKLFKGMLNVGIRPTFNFNMRTIEVNIFDFEDDIYNKQIKISFKERIRDEMKFLTIDALKEQINSDKIKCKNILGL